MRVFAVASIMSLLPVLLAIFLRSSNKVVDRRGRLHDEALSSPILGEPLPMIAAKSRYRTVDPAVLGTALAASDPLQCGNHSAACDNKCERGPRRVSATDCAEWPNRLAASIGTIEGARLRQSLSLQDHYWPTTKRSKRSISAPRQRSDAMCSIE